MYPVTEVYLREIIDEGNLGLCEMTHIHRAYSQGLLTPLVDLGGSGSPQYIVEKYISSSEKGHGYSTSKHRDNLQCSVECGRLH